MSAILMCDGCTEIFSVNEKGWKEFQESISVVENNPYNHGKRTMHMCANCAPNGGPQPARPRISAPLNDAIPEIEKS